MDGSGRVAGRCTWAACSGPRAFYGLDSVVLLDIGILTTIGIVLLVVGLVLLLGSTGRSVGGRKHFF